MGEDGKGMDPSNGQLDLALVSAGAPSETTERESSARAHSDEIWSPDLTRRLRVLLHTLPLDAMRRGDAMRDPDLRHFDSLALALRVLDIVIDRLGLEAEADREVVARVIQPVLAKMDAAAGVSPSAERSESILDKILGGLRNDSDARRPFREEYTSFDDEGHVKRHTLEFRLLFDAFHPSGRTVLKPSSEACNLYLRLLDLDIEDAQAAAEAVVESQLARGRFDEAVHSARQARIQSIRFRDKLLQILRDTRRDVDRVDWRLEAPRILDESLTHLERRVSVERGILDAADERLELIPDEDAGGSRAVAQVAELTRDCLLRHADLHEQLIGARNVFLDAQARQAFAPKPSRPLPNLWDDVVEPVLRLPIVKAGSLLERGFPLFVGPRVPALPSIESLVTWMLRPRRPRPRVEIPVEPIDAADLETELQRYSPEVRTAADSLLARAADGTPLSALLSNGREEGASDAVLEVVWLLALQGFATEDRNLASIAAEPIPDDFLEDPLLYGNNLLVSLVPKEG